MASWPAGPLSFSQTWFHCWTHFLRLLSDVQRNTHALQSQPEFKTSLCSFTYSCVFLVMVFCFPELQLPYLQNEFNQSYLLCCYKFEWVSWPERSSMTSNVDECPSSFSTLKEQIAHWCNIQIPINFTQTKPGHYLPGCEPLVIASVRGKVTWASSFRWQPCSPE